ncbi:MAG TPA: hypothetical protein VFI11_14825 [Anaerolineales bacterium]|nr:hypothetical protein [Anaerolineales bacterium]
MRTTSDLSLPTAALPAERWAAWASAVASLIHRTHIAIASPRGSRRTTGSWSDGWPWNSGMDRLAEQAYRPSIFRP